MESTSLLLLAVATSFDGFWGGFAVGLKRLRFGPVPLLVVGLLTVGASALAIAVGRSLLVVIDPMAGKIIGAALMIAIGGWLLREGFVQRRLLIRTGEPVRQMNVSKHVRLIDRLVDPFGSGNHDPEVQPADALALGIAVAADTAVLSMAAGFAGFNPYATPLLFGLAHLVMVAIGNSLGRNQRLVAGIGPLSTVPGLILIVIGIMRLIT